LGCFLYL